jgi:site-specific DNA-cytosine methylase
MAHRFRKRADRGLRILPGAATGPAQFGERDGQAPRVHDLDRPAPAICAAGHINLVEGTPEYDILFRMLEPHELAAAMGFDDEDGKYEFAGTKTEKVKQIGNAVPVKLMKAEVKAMMADAVRRRAPRPAKVVAKPRGRRAMVRREMATRTVDHRTIPRS